MSRGRKIEGDDKDEASEEDEDGEVDDIAVRARARETTPAMKLAGA